MAATDEHAWGAESERLLLLRPDPGGARAREARELRAPIGTKAPQPRRRVLVADGDTVTRRNACDALVHDGRFEICAEVGDASAAIDAAVRLLPDICLLDVEIAGGGLGAVWEISSRVPTAAIVMLTAADDDAHLLGALRAGACGYLLKGIDLSRLPSALAGLDEGQAAIPRHLVARLVEVIRDRGARHRPVAVPMNGSHLTAREWEVLELVGRGLTTAQIARRLMLSPGTVRTHLSAAMRKLDLHDRADVTRLFPRPIPRLANGTDGS